MGGNFKTGVKSSRAAETRCGCCICIDSAGLDSTAAVKPLTSNRHSGQHMEDLISKQLPNRNAFVTILHQTNNIGMT